MLLLFETPAGFALFKVLKEGKIAEAEDLASDFQTLEDAQKVVKAKAFSRFENTTEALAAATAIANSKLGKGLKKFLKKNAVGEQLAVADAKLGNLIKEKLGIQCIYSTGVMELIRGVRAQITGLISGLNSADMQPMSLGLSHSLSRYKLKFSPDKVDTMIVQAIGLLDDLDKELNTYAMRVREWYGWHFPEMTKVVNDNIKYAKSVMLMRMRVNAADLDFSEFLEEEEEVALKEAAVISMGTEVSEDDMMNIIALCDQVVALAEYRAQLYDYLKSRMMAIAPNLTILVGELVGARLIAHAGSLMNLAKQPASTVQILGAEKALFRALKTKHETPKYGLIYHASLIGQAPPKFKGKISRVLAAKSALAIRVDALGEDTDATIGLEARQKVEARLRQLEGRLLSSEAAAPRGKPDLQKYDAQRQGASAALLTQPKAYNPDADVTTDAGKEAKPKAKKSKVKVEEVATPAAAPPAADGEDAGTAPKSKKAKKAAAAAAEAGAAAAVSNGDAGEPASEGKKKKKKKAKEEEGAQNGAEEAAEEAAAAPTTKGKSGKKRERYFEGEEGVTPGSAKEKKKKKKTQE